MLAGVMERLPFRDGAFDAAVSLLALNLVDDKAGALAEAARVVAPGGTVVIADCVRPGDAPCARDAGHGGWARCLTGAPTLEGLRRLLGGAGLAPVREVDMTTTVRRLTGEGGGWDWPEFNDHGLGFVLSVLGRP
jgi:SAM-dependent methyltransferase